MKKNFPGYYQPTDDQFKETWNNCVFVIDANVLLNLYRYTPETRDELFIILDNISDRLWLPHQAALEYHKNRVNLIQQQSDTYESIQDLLINYRNKIEKDLIVLAGKGRHPFVNSDLLIKKITSTFTEIQEELKDLQENHPNFIEEDPVKNKVTDLFDGKVGSPYSSERLNQIYREGKDRFDEKVPPGYRDQDKGK